MAALGRTTPWFDPPSGRMPLAALEGRPTATCPPVVTFQLGMEFRVDGRRLGLLGSIALHVECACGHSGRVSVAGLVARHGSEARVCDAASSMRCRSCQEQDIKQVRWLG